MIKYEITFAKRVEKQITKLPQKDQVSIIRAITKLGKNPRPKGSKKLIGEENTYRIRQGNYRVVYDILDDKLVILVLRVRHRKDAYR